MDRTLLSIEDLAEYVGLPVATIRRWRKNGQGPRGIRIGRHVRFRPADVENWLEQQPDGHRAVNAGRRACA